MISDTFPTCNKYSYLLWPWRRTSPSLEINGAQINASNSPVWLALSAVRYIICNIVKHLDMFLLVQFLFFFFKLQPSTHCALEHVTLIIYKSCLSQQYLHFEPNCKCIQWFLFFHIRHTQANAYQKVSYFSCVLLGSFPVYKQLGTVQINKIHFLKHPMIYIPPFHRIYAGMCNKKIRMYAEWN